jgi:tetratricopeptide (TPR) repeat protein
MFKHKTQFVTLAAATILSSLSMAPAKTWRLEQGRNWQALSAESKDDRYLLTVTKVKKLVNAGQCEAARKELNQLKKDFPEIVGPDPNAFKTFTDAEMLFCKGEFAKAIRGYDKFLDKYYHESELYEAALHRQFDIATAFLAGQKKTVLGIFKIKGYAEGTRIMERIIYRVGLDAPIGIKAAKTIAESYEKRGKFNRAYEKWAEIFSHRQTDQIGKDALLGMARCKHAAYKGPNYDASTLVSARKLYENFKVRYPAEKIDVDKILNQINEQLAYKHLSTGRYYQKSGNKQVANFYYQMVIDNWPESTTAKMARKMMKDMGKPKNSRGEKVNK